MARVPVYTPQETVGALPGVRERSIASPELFSTGAQQTLNTGRAVGELGEQVSKFTLDMQERENADKLFNASMALTDGATQLGNDMRSRVGIRAWGATKEAQKWWDEQPAKYAETLTNDVQRHAFSQQIARLRIQSLDTIGTHEIREQQQSTVDSLKAANTATINFAAANAQNAMVLNVSRNEITARNQVLAKTLGWSPEVRDAQLSSDLTDLHKQVLQSLVDSNPTSAREYFDANKAEIAGAQHAEIEGVLKQGTLKTIAQTVGDDVMARGLSESQALAYAREKYTGDEEAAAIGEIKTRFAERDAARERSQRQAADTAFGIYARTNSLDQIPAGVLASMDGRTLIALRKEAAGEHAVTDFNLYYERRREAMSDPQAFAKRDLRADFPKLAKTERESLIDLQSKVKDPAELKDVVTFDQQLSDYHDQLGLTGTSKAKDRGQFDRAVTDAINSEQLRLGKKLDYSQRQKVIDRLVIEGRVEGSGLIRDDRGRLYEFADREDVDRFVPTIPRDERRKIEAALERAGRKATDAEITRLYKQKYGLP